MSMSAQTHANILIVGAGPTGLVLAISLARQGVPFRIVDQAAGPGEQSRAMGVQARTLEFYAQFGFADEVIGEGITSDTIHLRERDRSGRTREVIRVTFDELGKGLSPYPFLLTYPQDLHERLLVRQLEALGVSVERSTRLMAFRQDGVAGLATLEGPRGQETVGVDYLCGCDGAHSQVRASLDVGFSGGTYEQPFYVADVRIDGPFDADIYFNLGEHILALMMPVRMSGMHRLIGLVPPRLAARQQLGFEDVRAEVEELIGVHVANVNWFSRYTVHHRVADRFRIGQTFLLGDAGHIHSPVGGQGMNTGIGDAVNLGWKLAQTVTGRVSSAVLDSYEPERIAFARELVATTDRVFASVIAGGARGELVRRVIMPLAGVIASSFDATRHAAFRAVSQIKIDYQDSPISEGKAGKVAGGDRLPWVVGPAGDNFAPLTTLNWQLHVYGRPTVEVVAAAAELGLPFHRFPWIEQARAAGLAENAIYLVRPDGYVGLALPEARPDALRSYAQRLGVQPTASVSG